MCENTALLAMMDSSGFLASGPRLPSARSSFAFGQIGPQPSLYHPWMPQAWTEQLLPGFLYQAIRLDKLEYLRPSFHRGVPRHAPAVLDCADALACLLA